MLTCKHTNISTNKKEYKTQGCEDGKFDSEVRFQFYLFFATNN